MWFRRNKTCVELLGNLEVTPSTTSTATVEAAVATDNIEKDNRQQQ